MAFLIYSDDPVVVRKAWGALRRECEASGIRVLEVLRVEAGRYYPLLAGPHLREVGVAYDVSTHPLLVRGVVEGQVVEASRDALAATVGPDPAAVEAVSAALARPGVVPAEGLPATDAARRFWGDRVRALVTRHVDRRAAGATRPTAREVAWTVWAVQDVTVRDAAWALMTVAGARGHADFWGDVLRRTPEELVPAPACLFGWASWLTGNGALAWVGVDRCQAVDPDYSMARLLGDFLAAAVPPEDGEPSLAWDADLSGWGASP
ncbi:DUF4192 domain-containing protein [Nocardioides sp. TF02-7]|nr:DUF4192 domain-containing protein [Nocardioides sp. TF02-7]